MQISVPQAQVGQRSDAVLKALLLELLDSVQALEAGVLEDRDPECLHDLRVAVRRTRSILGQFKDVLSSAAMQKYRQRFGWMGSFTGPARDLDVQLQQFIALRGQLPEPLQQTLVPLQEFIAARRADAAAALAAGLQGRRYRAVKRGWRRNLTSTAPQRQSPEAAQPIKEIADRRIWKLYRRAVKEGAAITPDSPAADLHELRKTCKKLRYLLQFFREFYPEQELRRPLAALASLQDNLGRHQDLEVQRTTLRDFERDMSGAGTLSAGTIEALKVLHRILDDGQQEQRALFAERYAKFARAKQRRLYRELFRSA